MLLIKLLFRTGWTNSQRSFSMTPCPKATATQAGTWSTVVLFWVLIHVSCSLFCLVKPNLYVLINGNLIFLKACYSRSIILIFITSSNCYRRPECRSSTIEFIAPQVGKINFFFSKIFCLQFFGSSQHCVILAVPYLFNCLYRDIAWIPQSSASAKP